MKLLLVLAGTSLAIAACGSSSTLPKSTSSDAARSSGDASYAALLKRATTESPRRYEGPTTSAKAPAHLSLAVVTCSSELSGCISPADGIASAARKLGWSVHIYDGGGTPAKQNAAILDATSAGAKVIATVAIDPNLVQQGLQAAKRAHVPVVSGSNGTDTPNPVQRPTAGKLGYVFDVAPDYAALGRKAADWIIADSHGKANVAVFSDKEFPSVLAFQTGLLAVLRTCQGCTVYSPQEFNGSEVDTSLGDQTTGFLESNPAVNYVFSPYDSAAAEQVAAIATAGMARRVKVVSVLGSQQNLNFVRKGEVQVADVAYDNEYMGYMIVDGIIRILDHKPLFKPHGGNLPGVVLDKSNLPPSGANWTASFKYTAKFESLWGAR